MNAENFSVQALLAMRHSPVRNYVIPGLTSWLIGNPGPNGTIRLFECERDHQEEIAPHSHRFDFQCWVLRGTVRNRLWARTYNNNPKADPFRETTLHYQGDVGGYRHEPSADVTWWTFADHHFEAEQCYSMKANEVHSIHFSRGARVLFFEGAKVNDSSIALEPVVDGEPIPTMRVEPWMFRKEKT